MAKRIQKLTTRKGLFLLAFLLLLPFVPAPSHLNAQNPPKRILFITSEDPYVPLSTTIFQSIRSTLKSGSADHVQFYFEALDSSRIADDKYEEKYIHFLEEKYADEQIDLIYTLAPTALSLILKYRESIAPGTPVVYVGTGSGAMPDIPTGYAATGVVGTWQLRPTLDLAMDLQPEIKKVVVISGTTPVDQNRLEQAREELTGYNRNVEFDYLTDRTMEEMKAELASLSPGTVVIYLSFLLDASGKTFTSPEAIGILSGSSSVPIYGSSQLQFGAGIVGGYLANYESIGAAAGNVGLRILGGEKAGTIPVTTVNNEPNIDWRQLRRWNISEERVPAGTVVRFKEPTAWEQYKWQIIAIAIFSVLQTLLIGWLLFIRSRRKKAEEESRRFAALAKAEHQKLDEVIANVPGIVWESRIESETDGRHIEFVSDYVEKVLGYTSEDIASRPNFWLSVVLEEDQQQLTQTIHEILAGKPQGIQQFRCLSKSGGIVWVDAHLNATHDETGNAVGLRGVALDVTSRKLAEENLHAREIDLVEAQRLSQTGSWEWDPASDTVSWSEELYRIAGLDPVNPAPDFAEHKKLYTHESYERLASKVAAALESGEPYEIELEMIRGDGQKVWTNARGEVHRSYDPKTTKLRGTLQDISARKKAEQELEKALTSVTQLQAQLHEENIYLKEEIKLEHNFEEIIGHSDALQYVLFKIEQVAPTDSTVLITGETGTGKELIARAIHSNGKRKNRPVVKVNCAALSPTLIESELFGHEKGAFTGAAARKIGRFELADRATIFLDEVGELPIELQVKLLRVIQEGEFERLGSTKTLKVDVRIIAATNRDLEKEVKKGNFREDLLFRLNVFPISVPPLRERKDDIPALTEFFAQRFSKKLGKNIRSVSPSTIRTLCAHTWPGNIRELANVIERSVIYTQSENLQISESFGPAKAEETSLPSVKTLEEIERSYITQILNESGWRVGGTNGAAHVLGLNPSTLRTRMLKLGITRHQRADEIQTRS